MSGLCARRSRWSPRGRWTHDWSPRGQRPHPCPGLDQPDGQHLGRLDRPSWIGRVTSLGQSSRLALVTGQLSTTGSAERLTGMIGNVINAGSVEIGVTNGGLEVSGAPLAYNSANHLDLFASGNTSFLASIQNSGSGAITGVAGWDGSTGLLETISPLALLRSPPCPSMRRPSKVLPTPTTTMAAF